MNRKINVYCNCKVILSDIKQSWNSFFNEKSVFDNGFLLERDNLIPQERDFF